ncbi:unnamed protein product [Absidia cylindrospora]
MADTEMTSAEELRQEKLLAARRKLKKFQSKKADQVDGGDGETSSHKTSYEESRRDSNDVLVCDQGSPSTQRFDLVTTQLESLNSKPHAVHALPMTSSPPPPPPPAATRTPLVSSPSSPPSSLGEVSRHWSISSSSTSPSGQHYQLLQHQIQTLQQEKSTTVTRLDELQQQWTKFNEQHNQANLATEQKARYMEQQLCESAEKYLLLEQNYNRTKQQLVESADTCQFQHDKITDLQASLEAAQQHITRLTTPLSSDDMKQAKESNQTQHMENGHIPEQREWDDTKAKWEAKSALAETRQQQIDKLQTSDTSLHAETSRLIDMVKDLERQLTTAQTGNDIASKTDKDNSTSTSTGFMQHIEQQHDTTKQQLDNTRQQLDDNIQVISDLKEQIDYMENDRSVLKQQLCAAQASSAMKDEELETATVDLGHLEQQYASIKQTLDEKESLYTDLLKTKGEIEQQLQQTTAQNQSSYLHHRHIVIDKLYSINQKVDQVIAAHEKVEQKAATMEGKVKERDQHWQLKQNEWDNKIAQHDKISSELDATRTSLALAESQTKSHLDKLTEIEARTTELQLYTRKLEVSLQSSEEQRRILEQQVESLQHKLEEKREQMDTAEKARSNHQEEHTAMQSRLESSQVNLEAQQTLVDTLNAQLQSRTDQISDMDAKIKVLEKEKDDTSVDWELKYQELELQLKDQPLKQHALEEEKNQQDTYLKSIKARMEQLQQHTDDLEQQLVSERALVAATNEKIKHQTEELERLTQNDLLQQEHDKHQKQTESMSSQMASLQKQLVELQNEAQQQSQIYDDKVTALAVCTQKHDDMERLLEQTRYGWMAEQTKVANMTEDVTQLRRQVQHNMNDRQKLQRQLDETKQLLANRDQNTEALQWQVTDMENSAQHQLDLLSRQLKESHEEMAMKTKQVEQLQEQLSAVSAAASRATATIDQQNTTLTSSSPLTKPLPQSPLTINAEPQPSEREQQMENEMKELHQRLERQYEAFSTIREELTTARDRQVDVELNASKEKNDLIREQKELEQTVMKLRTEYQDHLERMWRQHQATRHHHEEDLTLGRNALDAAQVKLMQNGLSPVSENGFDWMNTDDDDVHHHEHDSNHDHNNHGMGTDGSGGDDDGATSTITKNTTPVATTLASVTISKSPSLGVLPPLAKPAFSEFLETPRCSGCQSEVIDI